MEGWPETLLNMPSFWKNNFMIMRSCVANWKNAKIKRGNCAEAIEGSEIE